MIDTPKGWESARLADIAEVRLGRQRSPSRAVGDHMRPYMRAANVTWDGIRLDDVKEMDFTPAEFRTYHLMSGDILLAEASGSASEVGKPAIWRDQVSGACFQNTLIRVRASSALVPFLFWHFFNDAVAGRFASASKGVGIHHLSVGVLSNWQTRIPPIGEQARIVEALDSYLSRLDAAVASLERVQAKLKAYRASVLKAAVEGRLVPTEAELARREQRDYEPASVLLQRILKERRRRWEEAELARLQKSGKAPKDDKWKAKYKEPVAPDTRELPALPEGWCWASVDSVIADGPQNGIYVPQTRYGSGTPILRISDYQVDWSSTSSELQRAEIGPDDENRYALAIGDIVVNRVNSPSHLGKVLSIEARHIPAVFESNMMRFSLCPGVEPRFLTMYLNASGGKQRLIKTAKWAVNQASINQQDVAACAIPVAPFAEQSRICSEVERLLSSAAAISESVNRNQRRSERLSQSILKWAFEGKLVDQDPADEPAEELLARIRAERAAASARPQSAARRRQRTATGRKQSA